METWSRKNWDSHLNHIQWFERWHRNPWCFFACGDFRKKCGYPSHGFNTKSWSSMTTGWFGVPPKIGNLHVRSMVFSSTFNWDERIPRSSAAKGLRVLHQLRKLLKTAKTREFTIVFMGNSMGFLSQPIFYDGYFNGIFTEVGIYKPLEKTADNCDHTDGRVHMSKQKSTSAAFSWLLATGCACSVTALPPMVQCAWNIGDFEQTRPWSSCPLAVD